MVACEKYHSLSQNNKDGLMKAIRERMCGKSNIADIIITDSELRGKFDFTIEVLKYNSRSGWSTKASARQYASKWIITFNRGKSGISTKYS